MHDCLPPLFLPCTCVLYLHIVCLSCTFTLYLELVNFWGLWSCARWKLWHKPLRIRRSVTCEHLHAMPFWPQTGTKLAYHRSRYGKWCWSASPYVNLHDALTNWRIELFSKLLPCRLTDYSEFRLFDTDSDSDVLDCSVFILQIPCLTPTRNRDRWMVNFFEQHLGL